MDAPPSYEQATGSSGKSSRTQQGGLSQEQRRRVRDDNRPLPEGWIRCWDPSNEHNFFVDTRKDPPRSIWVHPYEDQTYLDSLTPGERDRIQDEQQLRNRDDIVDESTDDEGDGYPKDKKTRVDEKRAPEPSSSTTQHTSGASSSAAGAGPSSAQAAQNQRKGKSSFGRSLKDKLTGTTHEERVAEREYRAKQEAKMYQQEQAFRRAMEMAMRTGQPQHLGKDEGGNEVYVEPPGRIIPDARHMTFLSPSILGGVYGPNSPGPTNARFIQPEAQYARPYGYRGGGSGMGVPIVGGLVGGMLLGGLLF